MKTLSLIEIEIPYDYKKNQTLLHRIWTAKSVPILFFYFLERERERERGFLLKLKNVEILRERDRGWIYFKKKKKSTVA